MSSFEFDYTFSDGRPDPDEAWELVAKDDLQTVVTNTEIRDAMAGNASHYLAVAKTEFKNKYATIVAETRRSGAEPTWFYDGGTEPEMRLFPVIEAVRKGRLAHEDAEQACYQYLEHTIGDS